jgi:hypothetical protein
MQANLRQLLSVGNVLNSVENPKEGAEEDTQKEN